MSEEENVQEKPISFLDFLGDPNIDKVRIPRIQRDYVQGGRDTKATDIRTGFLDDLKKAVTGERPLLLDFIYGAMEDRIFLPLDGQQRLTTLFLLYWYGVVTKLNDEARVKIIDLLKKFDYQTRLSSTDFCKHLLCDDIINAMVAIGEQKPSDVITGDPGYSRFWRYDPTVDSMLNMLDDIHEKFKDVSAEQWRDFFNNRNVAFLKYELKNSQAPDDLYVKMNARGKHLTHFENFKARLQQWMDADTRLDEEGFKAPWKRNMDGEWSEFFWQQGAVIGNTLSSVQKKDPAQTLIDKPFWIFLNRVGLFAYFRNNPLVLDALRRKPSLVEDDDPEKPRIDEGKEFLNNLRLSGDKKTDYVSPKYHLAIFGDDEKPEHQQCSDYREFAYQLVSNTLNTLVKLADSGDELDALVQPKWPCDRTKVPANAAEFFWGRSRSFTWQNLLMIWAFAGYCQKFYDDVAKIDRNKLAHWMQFCFQVSDGVDDQQDIANAASMIIMCLDKMEEAQETDIHRFLGSKYKDFHDAGSPFAWWHYSKTTSRSEIYHEFFGQELQQVGVSSDADGETRQLQFAAAAILDEAFKSYLRHFDQNASNWEDLLSKMEAHDRLHGRIQGIISEDDDDGHLLENAQKRYHELNNGERFTPNSKDFVTLVKFLDTDTPSLILDFSSPSNWGQVVRNADIAEAVCKVLLPPEKDPDKLPEWGAKILMDNPTLITGAASDSWGVGGASRRIGAYRGDGAYIFRKKNIASGAIVLNPTVHAGLRRLAEFHIPRLTMPDQVDGFYICRSPGIGGGEFCSVTLKAAPAAADAAGQNRVAEKKIVVDSHNGIRIDGRETPRISWKELAGYDMAEPEKQADIKARLDEIFAPPADGAETERTTESISSGE